MVKVFKNDTAKKQVLSSYDQLMERWLVDYQEHTVKTRYGSTHCITSGNPNHPPLLLFHGVGDNSAVMWILNIAELSKHFYCIAIDTIGGPGKSVPNESYKKNVFNQIDWINDIIEHFKLRDFNIAGVSNGAYMAYNYAAVNPDKVHRVVCLEGGMITNPLKAMFNTLLIMFPEILMPTQKNLFKVLRKLSSPQSDLFEKYPLIAEHLVMLMKSHNQQAMFAHKIEKYNKTSGTAVKDKLYFLIAEHHIDRKNELVRTLIDGGYHYKVIAKAGHGINHEQPEIINDEIIQFLNGTNCNEISV